MNMSKKIIVVLFIFCAFFLFSKSINAATTTTVINCSSFSTKDLCDKSGTGKCRWISGSCQAQYVAAEPCNDNNIRTVLKIAGLLLLLAKFIVPLLIIFYGVLDLYKSVIDKDEKSLPKQTKMLLLRVVTGLIVFFIPNLVHGVFKISDKLNIIDTDDYKTCASCVLDPLNDTECSTTDVFPDAGISE